MLAHSKIKLVQEMVAGLTKEEIIWLSGYLSGLAGAETGLLTAEGSTAAPVTAAAAVQKITIAYGTETGNAKKLATSFAAKAKKKGIQPKTTTLHFHPRTHAPTTNTAITPATSVPVYRLFPPLLS